MNLEGPLQTLHLQPPGRERAEVGVEGIFKGDCPN